MHVQVTSGGAMESASRVSGGGPGGSRNGSQGRRGEIRRVVGWRRWAWCGLWAGLMSGPLGPAVSQESPQVPAATSPAAPSPAVTSPVTANPAVTNPAVTNSAATNPAAANSGTSGAPLALGETAAGNTATATSAAGVEAGMASSAGGDSSSARKPSAGRLPRYFASLVDSRQRAAIYQIQATMAARIADLEKQLLELRQQEQREVEGVLTDEQRQQLQVLKSARSTSVSSR